uniref:Uncharacterized protein n=1 Tax=Arundo donax TaxID=35708 RepID=A0A0A8Y619_ARUDO
MKNDASKTVNRFYNYTSIRNQ